MRVLGYFVFLAAVAIPFSSRADNQAPDAAQVLAATRQALGGETKLSAVKSFIIAGRTRQLRGNNLVPILFEISCELPDKFVRIDEFPAQDQDPTTSGFNGNDLIQFPPPAAAQAPRRVVALKQDFARLTLGMFAASFPSYPLSFKYLAEGQAPEGAADILDVAGPANFAARLVVQRDTHLPVMLMWQQPAPAGRGGPPPAGSAPAQVEYRMYYGDFRDVDGMKFPFRIRRAMGGDTIEETTVDRIRTNPKIDPKKFEAAK